MKLKFDPELKYQRTAINAVIDLFDGQPTAMQADFAINHQVGSLGLVQTDLAIGNAVTLDEESMLANLHAVQERNDIAKQSVLLTKDFAIEMETGTGKTYVYLRTVFELHKKYGFKKFIIAVPSIAIREGVLKNIEIRL